MDTGIADRYMEVLQLPSFHECVSLTHIYSYTQAYLSFGLAGSLKLRSAFKDT
jgi:hypothetical protein